ncbi:MAG: Eco57I restriction-modification methylase domain-containing protein [Bacteroidetes bacterium]|nr:Eco57I restriction-modification methylase domain-containing protein [Bacteroidota bacterium]
MAEFRQQALEQKKPQRYKQFQPILDDMAQHPSPRYYILKSIILRNLYGVDLMPEAVEIAKLRLFLKLVSVLEPDYAQPNMGIEPLPDIDFNIRAGNTLVGFGTKAELDKGLEYTMDGLLAKPVIEEKCDQVARAFEHFKAIQLGEGQDYTSFRVAKDTLLERLAALRTELDRYLGKQYGKDEGHSAKQFAAWKESHKPFHWFAEYYGIVEGRGGFDVIIGNPPYIELKEVKDYELKGFNCVEAGNLYAVVMERCHHLNTANSGQMGFIVPVSSVSTERYVSLQKLIAKRPLHYSSFDDRPSRLFEGLEHIRLSVHLIGPRQGNPVHWGTKYNKWSSGERESLFNTIRYQEAQPNRVEGTLPKVSSGLDTSVLGKLFRQTETIGHYLRKQSSQRIYYSRKVGYFLQVLDFEPKVLDGRGKRRPPSEFKPLFFDKKTLSTAALCCFNSSLFNWFITVLSDCRHVNKREILAYPVNLHQLADGSNGKALVTLGDKLMKHLDVHSEERVMKFGHDTLTVQCILPKSSKPILDEIDALLAAHYGLSEEELDFVINYDIKYRMGDELGSEEE